MPRPTLHRSSFTDLARKSLHFVGYQGLSMIAVRTRYRLGSLAKVRVCRLRLLGGWWASEGSTARVWLRAGGMRRKDRIADEEASLEAALVEIGASDDLAAIHASGLLSG